jgi:hypothetical protein
MHTSKFIWIFFVVFLLHNRSLGQSLPKYTATVGGKESGKVKRGEFLVQQGIGGFKYISENHWSPIIIDSFSILVMRDAVVIEQIKNASQAFSANTLARLSKIAVDDRVLIYNICGKDYGNEIIFLRPIELVIK